MTSLVLELQSDAMNPHTGVGDLLRKARAVSVKLRATQISDWLRQEMHGYETASAVPEYRRLHADVKWESPDGSYSPFRTREPKSMEMISASPMTQPIGEIQALIDAPGSGFIVRRFTPHQEHGLMQGIIAPGRPVQVVPTTAVRALLEAVRNQVLDWALDLEAQGILGEGMTFSAADQARAAPVTHQTVMNIGTMTNSQIASNSPGAQQSIARGLDSGALIALVDSIAGRAPAMQLSETSRDELLAEIATLRAQAASPQPKLGILHESLVPAQREEVTSDPRHPHKLHALIAAQASVARGIGSVIRS